MARPVKPGHSGKSITGIKTREGIETMSIWTPVLEPLTVTVPSVDPDDWQEEDE